MPTKTVRFKNKSGDWRSKKLDRWEKAYQIQQKRSKRAISIDNSRNANRFMNPANDKLSDKELRTYNSWVKNPARSDLVGIDTKTSVVGTSKTKVVTINPKIRENDKKIINETKKYLEENETNIGLRDRSILRQAIKDNDIKTINEFLAGIKRRSKSFRLEQEKEEIIGNQTTPMKLNIIQELDKTEDRLNIINNRIDNWEKKITRYTSDSEGRRIRKKLTPLYKERNELERQRKAIKKPFTKKVNGKEKSNFVEMNKKTPSLKESKKDLRLKELEREIKYLKEKESPESFGSKLNYDLAVSRVERGIYVRKGKILEEIYTRKINEATSKTELKRLRTKLSKDKNVEKYTDQKTQVLANIGDKIRKKSRVMNK